MESTSKIQIIVKGEVKTLNYPTEMIEGGTQRAKAFFESKNEKPSITVHTKESDSVIMNKVSSTMSAKIYRDCIVTFLYRYIKRNISETLDAEWTSYGIRIGEPQSAITPMDLLNVIELDDDTDTVEGMTETTTVDSAIFGSLLMNYRLGSIGTSPSHANYRSAIKNRMMNVLSQDPIKMAAPIGVVDTANWYEDISFKRIIAALDMFMNKFPNNPFAKVRIATLPSRYKDCNALTLLPHASEVTGMDPAKLVNYCFLSKVAEEIDNIYNEEDEINVKHSYFPYLSDMSLVQRSPYSARANPNLHNWVHFICASLGNLRSFNSLVFSDSGIIILSSHLPQLWYAFRNMMELRPIGPDAELQRIYKNHLDVGENPLSPDELFSQLVAPTNDNAPKWELVKEAFKANIRTLGDGRPETVGARLKSLV
nr:MAG: putative nucleoprotein [Rhabdoviridae sp.]